MPYSNAKPKAEALGYSLISLRETDLPATSSFVHGRKSSWRWSEVGGYSSDDQHRVAIAEEPVTAADGFRVRR